MEHGALAARMAYLEELSNSLEADLVEVRRALRNQRRREATSHKLPKMVGMVGKLHFCRFGDSDDLRKFLHFKTGADAADLDAWVDSIIAHCRDMSLDAKEALLSGDNSKGSKRAAAELSSYCREASLHGWVSNLNVQMGMSPSSSTMLNELAKHGLQGKSRYDPEQPRKYKHTCQFLRRWRRRWNVTISNVEVCDVVDPTELKQKACPSLDEFCLGCDKWTLRDYQQLAQTHPVKKKRAAMRTHFWPRSTCVQKETYPKHGPIFLCLGRIHPKRRLPPCGDGPITYMIVCLLARRLST